MKQNKSFAVLIFIVIFGIGAALACARFKVGDNLEAAGIGVAAFIIAWVLSAAIQVTDPGIMVGIVRRGQFHALKGPGLFFMIPVLDVIHYSIDTCVLTTGFKAEKTLTKDSVPVDVDADLFWKFLDPKKAALEATDCQSAIGRAFQSGLRDVIGRTTLSELLEGRDKISGQLHKLIDERMTLQGINVISVELKDVLIPSGFKDAMTMEAQVATHCEASNKFVNPFALKLAATSGSQCF